MPKKLIIKVYAYNELATPARARAIDQLASYEVNDPLAILESQYTETGVYLAPELFEIVA